MNSSLWITLIAYFTVYFTVDWTGDWAYLIPMFSLGSWFLYFHGSISCSTCSKSTKSMKRYGNISAEWAKILYFVWEKVLFYTEVKVSYYNNIFENVFRTSGAIGLITILYVQKFNAKKVFQLLEKYFHWQPGFQNFEVISMF